MKTSLLISTYNWPQALELVLKSLKDQSVMPHEVLIADDGSKDETKHLICSFQNSISTPIFHFWHEDKGFRKATILNRALASATGEYIIQIDGDCIMHPDFIRDHKREAQKEVYLYGSRVNIEKNYLEELFRSKKTYFNLFSKGIKKRTRTLNIPFLAHRYKPSDKFSEKYRGCNVSYWRNDLISVNGYDENFEGWGREDSELILRMMNNGIQGKRLRYGGIVYHIWHPQSAKTRLETNDKLQESTVVEKRVWTTNGIDKYLT